jgi:hypothetical protein
MTANFDALKTASHPERAPSFHYTRYQEGGHTWLCAFVDWHDGHLDSEPKCICPENEDNFFFFEQETELVEGLYQTLKRRRNQSTPPKPNEEKL